MGVVILPTSPWMAWSYTKQDGSGEFFIYVQVTFAGTWGPSEPLTGGEVFRDPASPASRIVLGDLDPVTGQPTNGAKVFNVPVGTTTLTAAQLAANGFSTIGDITSASQITAIP